MMNERVRFFSPAGCQMVLVGETTTERVEDSFLGEMKESPQFHTMVRGDSHFIGFSNGPALPSFTTPEGVIRAMIFMELKHLGGDRVEVYMIGITLLEGLLQELAGMFGLPELTCEFVNINPIVQSEQKGPVANFLSREPRTVVEAQTFLNYYKENLPRYQKEDLPVVHQQIAKYDQMVEDLQNAEV